MAYLTVPITAKTVEQSKQQISSAANLGADMVELRLDYIEGLNQEIVKILIDHSKESKMKTIATCRRSQEGGVIDYPRQFRIQILAFAAQSGADYIDCELATYKTAAAKKSINAVLKNTKAKLILSVHDFKKPITNLQEIYDSILLTCPVAIPKIAYFAKNINDCFAGFDLLHTKETDLILIAMGQDGLITRLLANKLDSLVCFASLDNQTSTAPGQITVSQMRDLFRFEAQNEQTELFGVIGNPIEHSLSPLLHNTLFRQMNMNKLYLPILLKGDQLEFDTFMENVTTRQWLNFRGFSVTIPHKVNALDYVSKIGGFIDDQAAKIDAVNTLVIGYNERVNAYNTDYEGAIDALVLGMNINRKQLEHKKVAVLGAGGVSRAVVAGLTDVGARVTIYNRTAIKAKRLANEFKCQYADISEIGSESADILVNCTSVGMYPKIDQIPVSQDIIYPDMTVFDTVYNPKETKLLATAKEKGAIVINGLEMFINQAIEQFRHFTGKNADRNVVKKIFEEKF